MANAGERERNSSGMKKRGGITNIAWGWWVASGALLVVAVGLYFWISLNRYAFSLDEGPKQVLILIRQDVQTTYRVKFEGSRPVDLRSLHVMLAGQILHVDVKQVTLVSGDEEIVLLPDGSLPSGSRLNLDPGEVFDVRITFLGQSLGGNYLYGFKIDYGNEGRQGSYELVLDFDYSIIVE